MDTRNNNFADQQQEFRDNRYSTAWTEDANIDPMLTTGTTVGSMPISTARPMDPQFVMDSAMWNQAMDNPVGFLPHDMPGMALTGTTNSPQAPTEAHSSSRTTSSEPVFETSRTSSKSSVPSVNSTTTESSKSRRSSAGTRSGKPQRRRASNQSVSSPPGRPKLAKEPVVEEQDDEEDEDELDEEDGSKRSKFLKRNRIAASKCRQKKKEWVNNLEETRHGLEHQHSSLQMEYNGLVDEVSRMKNQLMQHASCNDSNIDQWIENEARRFVQRTAATQYGGQGQNQNQHQPPCDGVDSYRHGHSRSRRSSGVTAAMPQSAKSEVNYDHMPDSMLDL